MEEGETSSLQLIFYIEKHACTVTYGFLTTYDNDVVQFSTTTIFFTRLLLVTSRHSFYIYILCIKLSVPVEIHAVFKCKRGVSFYSRVIIAENITKTVPRFVSFLIPPLFLVRASIPNSPEPREILNLIRIRYKTIIDFIRRFRRDFANYRQVFLVCKTRQCSERRQVTYSSQGVLPSVANKNGQQ